ncbi:putative nuclease HARBI1 [Spodoptera frugiperda]|uniref:Nuclease HARBI1 n=1 Tax=Spodoptera frugiperda TaxID=7108 RepID=A0A9R0E6Y0_SPOFR|nr:putative nuclease HARBI1 [Spodoptera frugiperda]
MSSLLKIGRSTLSRLVAKAREVMTESFVPAHLGLEHLNREEVVARNLYIPESLIGNPEANLEDRKTEAFVTALRYCKALNYSVHYPLSLEPEPVSSSLASTSIANPESQTISASVPTNDEPPVKRLRFYQKFGFPGILGCIDGTHVAILRPHIHEERYYNRKGFHSLNVVYLLPFLLLNYKCKKKHLIHLQICDSDLNILCILSTPGSAHDSTVWQSHPLSLHLKQITENTNEQVFLLGDSGYPLRKTMMTPILNTIEGTPQHHYYVKHVTARNTVERCIGVLKARFR